MMSVIKEIIYRPSLEDMIKVYLEKMTNSYPNGCYVSLTVNENNDIIAEVTPKATTKSYTYSTSYTLENGCIECKKEMG